MPSRGIQIHQDMRQYDTLLARIAFFSKGAANKIVRQGLRSSLPPIRHSMKSKLLALRRTSPQSSGATIRAMTTKVRFPGARVKGRGYALVGIDWDYSETHYKNTALDRKQAGLRRRAHKLYGVATNKSGKSNIIRSYQTSQARVSRKLGRRAQVNRPSKYWHLINNGFRHRSGKMVSGRRYADRSARDAGQAGRDRFLRIIEGYLTRAGFGRR